MHRRLLVLSFLFICSTAAPGNSTFVCPKNQWLIRNVLRAVGVSGVDQIDIASRAWGGAGASIRFFPWRVSLVVNEEWFNSLGDGGKCFVIGHEAGHLKRCHGQKMLAAVMAGAPIVGWAFFKGSIKGGIAALAGWLSFLSWYSQRMEMEADGYAARTPEVARAGVNVMRICQRYTQEERPSFMRRIDRVLYAFSHPPFERRIKALESFAYKPMKAN